MCIRDSPDPLLYFPLERADLPGIATKCGI
jgi:hypothetical protein